MDHKDYLKRMAECLWSLAQKEGDEKTKVICEVTAEEILERGCDIPPYEMANTIMAWIKRADKSDF